MEINILDFLEAAAKAHPDKTAFADTKKELSYAVTVDLAKRIGSALAEHIQPEEPVAVFMEKCAENLPAFFGIVYAGGFYVPMDTAMPQKRVMSMLDTLQAKVVIADEKNKDKLKTYGYGGQILLYEELACYEICQKILNMLRSHMIDTNPLYAIFTSGSTGVPKGVLVSHRAVIDFISQFTETFGITEKDILANQAPFDFDVSVKDIYSTIKTGATMWIVPKMLFSFPTKLIAFLNEHRVTTIIWAVSALCIVSNLNALEAAVPASLEKIMFSGEVLPIKHFNNWKRHLPDVMYVNLYGPTEITCNCTYYIVDREFGDKEVLPIGRPFKNKQILLLDENGKEVSKGQIGEICVRGNSLALGYYNNPEKTREAFRQNPLNDKYPELIYHTGDLAKEAEDGNLIFMSRKDYQIKHMGHRIELGEIETAANSIEGMQSCCCIYDEEDNRIRMVYVAPELSEKDILLKLQESLPKYMCPNRLVAVKEMPMNKNNKIDRVYLKDHHKE